MNIQEYISSGIVESYVLGSASPTEIAEFERMCSMYPEVKAARESFELSLEKQALHSSLVPADITKAKIFAEIEKLAGNAANNFTSTTGTATSPSGQPFPNRDVISMQGSSWLRYLAVAAIILLVGSTALNLYFFNRYREYSSRYAELLKSQATLAATNNNMQTKLDQYQQSLSMMKNPDMTIVKMPASNVPASPDASSIATVFWNKKSQDVYLMIGNLPDPGDDRQYQLWAIVDGKPVDAGVFEVTESQMPVRMKNVSRADVFAITLEQKGGSDSPKGPMYVMGKV